MATERFLSYLFKLNVMELKYLENRSLYSKKNYGLITLSSWKVRKHFGRYIESIFLTFGVQGQYSHYHPFLEYLLINIFSSERYFSFSSWFLKSYWLLNFRPSLDLHLSIFLNRKRCVVIFYNMVTIREVITTINFVFIFSRLKPNLLTF